MPKKRPICRKIGEKNSIFHRPNPNINQTPLEVSLQDFRENEQNSPSLLGNETPPEALIEPLPFQQELSLDSRQVHSKPERNPQQEPLDPEYAQSPQPTELQCSKSKEASGSGPSEFRLPLKAMPRANKRTRRPGRSLIATDTPEKENIRIQRTEAKKKKLPKKNKTNEPKKKAVRKVLQSDSDDETENISLHDEDSDWQEEDEESDWCEDDEVGNKMKSLTDEKLLNNVLPRLPKEEDYVLVRFSTKRKS
uniref:Uncharacterized protein n=1 Tax=Heliothis virescens TaxID=7102 RepID=A0A2A4KAF7_HELVI